MEKEGRLPHCDLHWSHDGGLAVAKRADAGVTARERGRLGLQRVGLSPSMGNREVPAELSVVARGATLSSGIVRPLGRNGRQRGKRVGHPDGVFRSLGSLASWRD